MIDHSKVNPVLTYEKDVPNYSFLTIDDELYLVSNTVIGDGSHAKDYVIPAGEYLNGFVVKAWEGQKLVIDAKHIQDEISELEVGDALVPQEDGTLKKSEAAGVHLVVTDLGVALTELAVKAKVVVAAE